jgi:hypothetical protein
MNYTFDQLFEDSTSGQENSYRIDDIMEEVSWQVIQNGLLSFRLFWIREQGENSPQVQQTTGPASASLTYTQKQIGNAPTVPQQSRYAYRFFNNAEQIPALPQLENFNAQQKFLRSRGIRVIAAEFENVRPKMSEIDDTRLYAWSSELKRDIDEQRGRIEQEHTRIMSQAIAETQENVIDQLLVILESGSPEDVAILQFLSSMEEIINRDDSENFLPRDLNNLIAELRQWVQGGKK